MKINICISDLFAQRSHFNLLAECISLTQKLEQNSSFLEQAKTLEQQIQEKDSQLEKLQQINYQNENTIQEQSREFNDMLEQLKKVKSSKHHGEKHVEENQALKKTITEQTKEISDMRFHIEELANRRDEWDQKMQLLEQEMRERTLRESKQDEALQNERANTKKLQDQIAQLNKQIEEMEQMRDQISTLGKEKREILQREKHVVDELNNIKTKLRDLEQDGEEKSNLISNSKIQFKREIEAVTKERDSYMDELNSVSQRLGEVSKQSDALQQENLENTEQIAQFVKDLAKLQQAVHVLDHEKQNLLDRAAQETDRISNLKLLLDNAERLIDEYKAENERLERESEIAKSECKELKERNENLRREVAEAKQMGERFGSIHRDRDVIVKNLQDVIQSRDAELKEKEKENSAKHEELIKKEDKLRKVTAELEDLREKSPNMNKVLELESHVSVLEDRLKQTTKRRDELEVNFYIIFANQVIVRIINRTSDTW
jgi:chromosome segregation ATPase